MDPLSALSVPTDNLYKFMAIAGLIIFGVCMVLPIYLNKDLNEQYLPKERKIETDLFNYEYSQGLMIKKLNSEYKSLEDNFILFTNADSLQKLGIGHTVKIEDYIGSAEKFR